MRKVLSFGLAGLVLSACGAFAYQNITPSEVYEKMASGDEMVIVDVREPWEYESGHISGAINMPWNSGVLQARYEELPSDKEIIVVCRSGNRSVSASLFLDGQGFDRVFNMLGGMLAWKWDVATPGSGTHHHGPGWIYRDSEDSTFIHCPTDSLDWLEFPPGGMMHHHFPDSIYCNFVEMHPDSVPWPNDSTMIGGYHVDISDPMGHGMMGGGQMGFGQGIGLHLHYDDQMLIGVLEDGMMLRYWDEGSGQWIDVPAAMQDMDQNIFLVSQASIRSYYGLFATPMGPKKGDLNSDGLVDITDTIVLVQIILGGQDTTPEQIEVADLNTDGAIDILDVLQVVNIILGVSPKGGETGWRSQAFLRVPSSVVVRDRCVTIPISLETETPVSGLQLAVTYDGRKLRPGIPKGTDKTEHMTFEWTQRDSEILMLFYSTQGKQIPAGPAVLVEIPFEPVAGAAGECALCIGEAIVAGSNGESIEAMTSVSAITLGAVDLESYRLFQNYPNPFNPETEIAFQIPGASGDGEHRVALKIYNVLGQEIRTLLEEQKRPGFYSVRWDGRDNNGTEAVSGFYFYRLSAKNFTATKTMVLMK
ncbi:MAG: T9SS type A sorting domain-containing protein [Gemmatimonadota bacterium]|nr:MAG: T9SS type A sorting domain-containing protein [Gemmatimonadota bacterium]